MNKERKITMVVPKYFIEVLVSEEEITIIGSENLFQHEDYEKEFIVDKQIKHDRGIITIYKVDSDDIAELDDDPELETAVTCQIEDFNIVYVDLEHKQVELSNREVKIPSHYEIGKLKFFIEYEEDQSTTVYQEINQ